MAIDTDKQGWLISCHRQELIVESIVCGWLQQKAVQNHATDLDYHIEHKWSL